MSTAVVVIVVVDVVDVVDVVANYQRANACLNGLKHGDKFAWKVQDVVAEGEGGGVKGAFGYISWFSSWITVTVEHIWLSVDECWQKWMEIVLDYK